MCIVDFYFGVVGVGFIFVSDVFIVMILVIGFNGEVFIVDF